MRRVVLQMMTTLNGRVDDPGAWLDGIGDDLYAEIDRLYAAFDAILVGQTTYEEMAAYWPGAEAEEGASESTKSMARKTNAIKKYVFSGAERKTPLGWNNVERVVAPDNEAIVRFTNDLKARPGADIHLSGGARLAQTVVRLGLVDEYRLFVYPVISAGAAWFDQVDVRRDLELISVTAFEGGVAGLYYRPM